MHGLDKEADGFAASGAAGGALTEAEGRRMAKDSVLMATGANRRFSGFTCYAALAEHKASNIEEVSYQILLGRTNTLLAQMVVGRDSNGKLY